MPSSQWPKNSFWRTWPGACVGRTDAAGVRVNIADRLHQPTNGVSAMSAITMVEARAHLSRWVDAIVRGDEREIVIARHGLPFQRDRCPGR